MYFKTGIALKIRNEKCEIIHVNFAEIIRFSNEKMNTVSIFWFVFIFSTDVQNLPDRIEALPSHP